MIGYTPHISISIAPNKSIRNPKQYCNIVAKYCELDVCCYECTKELCEYRCHLFDYTDYTKCKHAEKSKITIYT